MLGSALCQLYSPNNKVFAFHRDKIFYLDRVENYSLDLIELNKLNKLFGQIKPDIVIHCAGLINIDFCEREPELANAGNVTVTENIARICSSKTKLIYISTDQVYGDIIDYSENRENLNPLNQYGKTKLLGEQKVRALCTDYIIVRTNIFGWNIKPARISSAEWMYDSLKKGKDITLFTDYTFSPIHTGYFGEILMQLIEMDFKGLINVGSLKPCSKYDFGMQLAKIFGFNSSHIKKRLIDNHPFLAPRFVNLGLNVKKLLSLNIQPPNYELSIRQFSRDRLI